MNPTAIASRILVLGGIALAAACGSPVAAECQKRSQCGMLIGQTYEECVQAGDEQLQQPRSNGDPSCYEYVRAQEMFLACRAAQTCETLEQSFTAGCESESQNLAGEL